MWAGGVTLFSETIMFTLRNSDYIMNRERSGRVHNEGNVSHAGYSEVKLTEVLVVVLCCVVFDQFTLSGSLSAFRIISHSRPLVLTGLLTAALQHPAAFPALPAHSPYSTHDSHREAAAPALTTSLGAGLSASSLPSVSTASSRVAANSEANLA